MTREDIIDAAFEVWGRELYKTTSLSKLAERLGVSKPALYRHFPGKEALLDAMSGRFYDAYTGELKPVMEEALKAAFWQDKVLIMARFIMAYFARHFDYFIYSLIHIHGEREHHIFNEEEFTKRGISFAELMRDLPVDDQYPSALFLMGTTALFETAKFHKQRRRVCKTGLSGEAAAAEPAVEEVSAPDTAAFVDAAAFRIRRGLDFGKETIGGIPFEKLESLVSDRMNSAAGGPPDPLLKAVAEAVAKEGPWSASMETVAKRTGVSKSGLYAHFKNKREMFSRLFMTEFERIAETAAACSALSRRREERLYLTLFSVAEYLKARPEILIALDWIRIQRLELDISVPARILDFFAGLDLSNSKSVSQWTLFLLVSVFTRRYHRENSLELPCTALRRMYRFIMLGVEGM